MKNQNAPERPHIDPLFFLQQRLQCWTFLQVVLRGTPHPCALGSRWVDATPRPARSKARGLGRWQPQQKGGGRWLGTLSGKLLSLVLFCKPRGFSARVGAASGAQAGTGRGGETPTVILGIPHEAWLGAQASMEYDFKERKLDSGCGDTSVGVAAGERGQGEGSAAPGRPAAASCC